MGKEKLLLLGLLVDLLYEYHQGIGNRSIELCYMLIDGKKELGSSYAETREKLGISMSTVHKVFRTFAKAGIVKRNRFGEFYFDKEAAMYLLEERG